MLEADSGEASPRRVPLPHIGGTDSKQVKAGVSKSDRFCLPQGQALPWASGKDRAEHAPLLRRAQGAWILPRALGLL